jgi:hypothetical protein
MHHIFLGKRNFTIPVIAKTNPANHITPAHTPYRHAEQEEKDLAWFNVPLASHFCEGQE